MEYRKRTRRSIAHAALLLVALAAPYGIADAAAAPGEALGLPAGTSAETATPTPTEVPPTPTETPPTPAVILVHGGDCSIHDGATPPPIALLVAALLIWWRRSRRRWR